MRLSTQNIRIAMLPVKPVLGSGLFHSSRYR